MKNQVYIFQTIIYDFVILFGGYIMLFVVFFTWVNRCYFCFYLLVSKWNQFFKMPFEKIKYIYVYMHYERCCMQFIILLVAINSINFFIKIWRWVAAYRQVRNFVHIILKKTGRERERDILEKKEFTIQHYLFQII